MDTLFDSAAERMALETGRPLSQTRIEVAFGSVGVSGPLFDEAEELACSFVEEPASVAGRCSVHGTPLLLESGGGGKVSCPRCA